MSADEYLVSPWDYEGKAIKLNVAFVRPAHFQSPLPDVIFYHAMTLTVDRKPGGEMIIAVPKDQSEHFAHYYGLDFHGRNSRILSGTLLLAHRPHPPFGRRDHDSAEPAPTASPTPAESSPTASATPATDSNENKPPKQPHRAGVWFVDYKGLSADLFSKHKEIELPEGPGPVDNHHQMDGPPGGPRPTCGRPQHPPRR